jgi:predicted enzyme related to lactoylglutathione lyase
MGLSKDRMETSMDETRTDRPSWVDLSSTDAAGSRDFYARLFGWQIEVSPDPQYGGYALCRIDGRDVAGIGPTMNEGQPTAWTVYIGNDDTDALASKVPEAGGSVLMGPMDVGDQGRLLLLQDPAGAVIGVWQRQQMGGFQAGGANTFGWAELSTPDVDRVTAFYERVFGWSTRQSPFGEGMTYTEFLEDGASVAGAMQSPPDAPNMPAYWLAYFYVSDVDEACRRAVDGGAAQMVEPQDFGGGRFAVLTDPQGAAFGLLRMMQ